MPASTGVSTTMPAPPTALPSPPASSGLATHSSSQPTLMPPRAEWRGVVSARRTTSWRTVAQRCPCSRSSLKSGRTTRSTLSPRARSPSAALRSGCASDESGAAGMLAARCWARPSPLLPSCRGNNEGCHCSAHSRAAFITAARPRPPPPAAACPGSNLLAGSSGAPHRATPAAAPQRTERRPPRLADPTHCCRSRRTAESSSWRCRVAAGARRRSQPRTGTARTPASPRCRPSASARRQCSLRGSGNAG